ncbi:MAG: tetratricopeptide repeat protein [Myxococcales bacterium]|nr:tetratricopeptide repeat protein [Myxococcales bacterium]
MDADSNLLEHLTTAGELLRRGKMAEAGAEIAAALRISPSDMRALNLLGLLRFQSGQVDEAYAVYSRLVSEHPADPALRLNLGLCELRRNQPEQAVIHLALVVRSEPDNIRALSYYGLALFRAGRLIEARPILLRAGQHELVAEVDAKLGTQPGDALELADLPSLRPPRIVQPLIEELPPPTAPPLSDVLAATTIGEAPAAFSLTSDGLLLVQVVGHVLLRGDGVVASMGTLDFVPLGSEEEEEEEGEPTAGAVALFRAEGRGSLLLSPQGGRFIPLSLADGEELRVCESALCACSPSLLPVPVTTVQQEGDLPSLRLVGPGELVLRSPSELHALMVRPGQSGYLDETCVLGWTAGVTVSRDAWSESDTDGHLICSGHGHILLSVTASAR